MMKLPNWSDCQKMFNTQVLLDSQAHAVAEFPRESVGFVVDDVYVPLKNTHPEPTEHFRISKANLTKYAGRIQAVIHSHNLSVNPQTRKPYHTVYPSYDDQVAQINMGVPFGIQYVTDQGAGNILWWGTGVPVADWNGRPYIHAVYDCFTILRDYFEVELGITLPAFAHDDEWWIHGKTHYLDHIQEYGFEQVKDLQPNDVIFLCIRSTTPNHAMIYLGGDQGLHHLATSTSKIESINRFIDPQKSFFHSTWRYKDFIK